MKRIYLVIISFGLLLFTAGCSNNDRTNTNNQYCAIGYLLLDQSEYPSDTIFDRIISPIAEQPRESASRSVYYQGNWIGEIVIQYPSIERAKDVFDQRKKSIFHPDEVYGLWETPSELIFDNFSANQYETACGNVKNFGKRCIMLSRYEDYIVIFNMDFSNDGVTHEMFYRLVLKIDDRMSACVSQ
jgi:hypothetical protein